MSILTSIQNNSKGARSLIQPKIRINTPNDQYEREADAIANRIMINQNLPVGLGHATGLIGKSVQRKCATCEEEDERKTLMRKTESSVNSVHASPSFLSSLASSKGSGSPLSGNTRNFMENAFSTGFSDVRLHTNNKASEMSKRINAKAFTYSNDIYFSSGAYQPATVEGKRLLAHELVHTIQQRNRSNQLQRQSVREEIAGNATQSRDAGGNVIYTGSVERSEYRNVADRQARTNPIYRSSLNLRYNENTCQLFVPLTIRFINQAAGNRTTCGDISGRNADPIRPVSAARFNEIKNRFLTEIPRAMNGWYSVELEGANCGPCRTVPIVVEFTELNSAAADRTVIFTGNNGRSYVQGSTIAICGGDADDTGVLIHEGGHFALRTGDEYHETQGARPEERERPGEYSHMAQDAPVRLLEFHGRHFGFADAFLRSVYPSCSPRLQRNQTGPIEFNVSLGAGASFGRGFTRTQFSLGLQLGIPLTAMRRLSLIVGPNFTYLLENSNFLAGVRAGIEGRIPLGFTGSLGLTAFGEAGTQFNLGSGSGASFSGGYREVGSTIDLRLHAGGADFLVGLEGAAGTYNFDTATSEDYYRLGARLGLSW